MELTQAVCSRRAVRSYRATPMATELVQRLIDLAVHAPSAMNHQPWAFVVLVDGERIEEYSALAKQFFLAHEDVPTPPRGRMPAEVHWLK
jgi:nitroreductase